MVASFPARLLAAAIAVAALASAAFMAPSGNAQTYPEIIPLPDGWSPEGIVVGKGPVIYSGSRANGAIYAADLRTGEGEIVVPGAAGRVSVGLSFDDRSGYVFAAGGQTGNAYVYDTTTGGLVAEYALAACTDELGNLETFVNDVVVTKDAAYFTDSMCPVIYVLPLGAGGSLPDPASVEVLELTGDYEHIDGAFNVNGIDATADGKSLVIVQSATGLLFKVDPDTGAATEIDLGGTLMTNGDGILLHGKTLYVVQNRLNQVSVIDLSTDLLSGEVVEVLTSPAFDVPTTIAKHGKRLYVVNGRFNTPGAVEFDIVQVPD